MSHGLCKYTNSQRPCSICKNCAAEATRWTNINAHVSELNLTVRPSKYKIPESLQALNIFMFCIYIWNPLFFFSPARGHHLTCYFVNPWAAGRHMTLSAFLDSQHWSLCPAQRLWHSCVKINSDPINLFCKSFVSKPLKDTSEAFSPLFQPLGDEAQGLQINDDEWMWTRWPMLDTETNN